VRAKCCPKERRCKHLASNKITKSAHTQKYTQAERQTHSRRGRDLHLSQHALHSCGLPHCTQVSTPAVAPRCGTPWFERQATPPSHKCIRTAVHTDKQTDRHPGRDIYLSRRAHSDCGLLRCTKSVKHHTASTKQAQVHTHSVSAGRSGDSRVRPHGRQAEHTGAESSCFGPDALLNAADTAHLLAQLSATAHSEQLLPLSCSHLSSCLRTQQRLAHSAAARILSSPRVITHSAAHTLSSCFHSEQQLLANSAACQRPRTLSSCSHTQQLPAL
jgi:hypothetical protein